jgi:hypothetical protein
MEHQHTKPRLATNLQANTQTQDSSSAQPVTQQHNTCQGLARNIMQHTNAKLPSGYPLAHIIGYTPELEQNFKPHAQMPE